MSLTQIGSKLKSNPNAQQAVDKANAVWSDTKEKATSLAKKGQEFAKSNPKLATGIVIGAIGTMAAAWYLISSLKKRG